MDGQRPRKRTVVGSMTPRWYGDDPAWKTPFQRDARRYFGSEVSVDLTYDYLTYNHSGLEVPGRDEPVPVTVLFEARPSYETFGLAPQDYPRVFADPGLDSPHRMHDDSLCLFYPGDPLERRWTSEAGLHALLGLIGDHLFFETYWRASGGFAGGDWLAPEAPHGYQGEPQ